MGAIARSKMQRWLVRIDPELYRDIDFHDHCDFNARAAYVDSLFYIAARQGPEDIYPHAELVAEYEHAADMVAGMLVRLGAWRDCGLGYQVIPRSGWRVVPDKRLPLRPEVRLAVYARDGFQCRKCGSSDDLTVDHVYPWILGGSDELGNLQTLCRSCNCRKGART